MIQPTRRDSKTTFRAQTQIDNTLNQIINILKMTPEQSSMLITFPRSATVKAGRV